MKHIPKYIRHSVQVLNYISNRTNPLSSVEIINKFKVIVNDGSEFLNGELIEFRYDSIGLTEKALKFLVDESRIIKSYSRGGRVMYQSP